MGHGDQLIASGLAKRAFVEHHRKVAFGKDDRIIWDKHSEEIFRNNPKVCFPGNQDRQKLEWVPFYKGNRGYNTAGDGHWIWNMSWRCTPGELFFGQNEIRAGKRHGEGFVVIEPEVVRWKSSAANKDWGFGNYQRLADRIVASGREVVQFVPPESGGLIQGARHIRTKTFREATAILKNAAGYVGAEGGMHHAAAALGIPGVVIFGGFIPPSVTGYDLHENVAGSDRFCGSFSKCDHCREAMAAISVDRVFAAYMERVHG